VEERGLLRIMARGASPVHERCGDSGRCRGRSAWPQGVRTQAPFSELECASNSRQAANWEAAFDGSVAAALSMLLDAFNGVDRVVIKECHDALAEASGIMQEVEHLPRSRLAAKSAWMGQQHLA
jgi:hypothetical protein